MAYSIIRRETWGAQRGTGWGERPLPVQYNFLHHPAMAGAPGADATLEEDIAYVRRVEEVGYSRFASADKDENGNDEWPGEAGAGISYTWLVMKSGRIFEGHDVERQSSHTSGYNYTGVGIAWAGNFVNGEEPTLEQVNATVWLLGEAVRQGWTEEARIHFGHKDVYPTACPASAYEYIPLVNELVETGGTMAKRRPTSTDIRALAKNLKGRGFTLTCEPAMGETCRKYHKHSPESRHFDEMAIDVSFDPRPGVPVSDYERAHLDLLGKELERDPNINWRWLWRESSGAHHDHLHIDDSAWYEVHNYANIEDGGAVLISPKAFPYYKPVVNKGFTLETIVKVQTQMTTLGFYSGALDGYRGPQTQAAIKAFQTDAGLTADGLPGANTQTALNAAVSVEAINAGFTREYIEEVQRILKTLGYYSGDIDGLRGPATETAIRAFQKAAGLAVDGLPGTGTMTALTAALKAAQTPSTPPPAPEPVQVPKVTVFEALDGSSRYEVAVSISKANYPNGAETVYIAASETDDIGLAASAKRSGPVLLHRNGALRLRDSVRNEIVRLKPKRVVFVGGTSGIPTRVRNQIRDLLP